MPFQVVDHETYVKSREKRRVIQIDLGGGVVTADYEEPWDRETIPEDVYDEEFVRRKQEELVSIKPSTFTEFAIRVPDKERQIFVPFSFEGRRYMRQIYDTPAPRRLLVAGRQVEKCILHSSTVSYLDGYQKQAGKVKVGNRLVTLARDGVTMTTSEVTWVSERYLKPCIRIKTRQGHVIEVSSTHPVRTFGDWVEAGDLKVKDRIGVVRRCGSFIKNRPQSDERIKVTAYLIADGNLGSSALTFTKNDPRLRNDYLKAIKAIGDEYTEKFPLNRAAYVTLRSGQVRKWLTEDGLFGKLSASKFIPRWVFKLDRQKTALFLSRLLGCDGHALEHIPGRKWELGYSSMSRRLVRDVQALLWKFGIPSKIREVWPAVYKKRNDRSKIGYILRVETQEGVRRFLDITAFGKSEEVAYPEIESNNNRDTLPKKEITDLIRRTYATRFGGKIPPSKAVGDGSLYAAGLRLSPKYAMTYEKLAEYVNFFRADDRYNQRLVDELEKHLNSDIYWDEIESIEDIGEQECIDFEVEGTHNFVTDGVITHNSTCLGNTMLSYACIITSLNALYVSPTNQQTTTFSRDRLKEPIETSEYLKSWTTTKLSDSVYLKKFVNRSQITMRYAYLSADRVRGIPADLITCDEIQDLVTDNIPIIEECASHSHLKIFIYAGTPKSYDNTIQYYWTNLSTQNEWVVPCHRHTISTPGTGKMVRVHWNVLTEDSIGKKSLICDSCGGSISPKDPDCQWAAMKPEIYKLIPKPYEGFRIPQIMVPWVTHDDILQKQKTYSRPKFFNEVLGLACDSGARPLTSQDILQNCESKLSLAAKYQDSLRSTIPSSVNIYAGLDWGSGTEHSFTVLTLGAYIPGTSRFTILYMHRFDGPEMETAIQLEKIKRFVHQWRVVRIGADYGGGHWPNDDLMRTFGHQRVQRYQYSQPKAKVKFEAKLKRWIVNRTEVMSDVFNAIKRGNVFRFPRWEEFRDPFAADMLNIFSEYNEKRRMSEYKKSPSATDDSFHSLVFCFLASMIDNPRPDIISPMAVSSDSE